MFVTCVWCLAISFMHAFPEYPSIDTAVVSPPFEYAFRKCPSISTAISTSPYCECRYGPAYDPITNTCPKPECPPESIAEPAYPNCTCTEVNFSYSEYLNECFRVCPENSRGYWPNCICDDKLAVFNKSMW